MPERFFNFSRSISNKELPFTACWGCMFSVQSGLVLLENTQRRESHLTGRDSFLEHNNIDKMGWGGGKKKKMSYFIYQVMLGQFLKVSVILSLKCVCGALYLKKKLPIF